MPVDEDLLKETGMQASPDYILPPSSDEPGFLGQQHNYSVVFRGNGEAVVSAKFAFTNKTDSDMTEMELRVPGVEPKSFSVYQVILDKRCARYEQQTYDPLTRTYSLQKCAQYQDPDYYNYWGEAKYQKADYDYELDTLTVKLPTAISANKSGAFFIYYRTFGYAKKNVFGAFDYDFETLKVADDVRALTVGISTDSDLVLSGVEGDVNYRTDVASFDKAESGLGVAPAASAAMDSYVGRIGYGQLNKQASNLAPLEGYTVNGSYAKNRFQLYAKGIVIALVTVLVFVGVGVFLLRLVLKKIGKNSKGGGISENAKSALVSAGVSLISAILTFSYTLLVIFLSSQLNNLYRYNMLPFFVIGLIVISFIVYVILIIGPSVVMGMKRGAGWGIGLLGLTLLWLIIFFIISMVVVYFMFSNNSIAPLILY